VYVVDTDEVCAKLLIFNSSTIYRLFFVDKAGEIIEMQENTRAHFAGVVS
jgi:hypothetical protein